MNNLLSRVLLAVALTGGAASAADYQGKRFTTLLDFELGVNTLTQVEQKLGAAKLQHTGRGSSYFASLCYQAKSAMVQFVSGGMGGANLKLLGFALRPLDAKRPCGKLAAKVAGKKLQLAGLSLGMSKSEFTQAIGGEVKWEDQIGQVAYQDKRDLTHDEISEHPPEKQVAIASGRTKNYFDVSVAVIGTFNKDKLVVLEVWKSEVY